VVGCKGMIREIISLETTCTYFPDMPNTTPASAFYMYLLRSVCRIDHSRSSLSAMLTNDFDVYSQTQHRQKHSIPNSNPTLSDHSQHSSLPSLPDLSDFRPTYSLLRHGSRSHPRNAGPQPRIRAQRPEVIRARFAEIRHHTDSAGTLLSREQAGVRRSRHFHRPQRKDPHPGVSAGEEGCRDCSCWHSPGTSY
jgi:hypothetical protein